jgi:hypothetical protein
MLIVLALLSCLVHVLGQRNITGVASPYVVPADGHGNFTCIVRGVGFGTRDEQPSDLICRMKPPDWEALAAGPFGPAVVINDTAIECELAGYLTYGIYSIAVESASHSDPSKHIWWSHGTSEIMYRNLVEVAPDRRPFLSNELSAAELLVAVNIGAIFMYPGTADADTVTVCAELTAESLLNPGPNPYLPSDAKLDPSLEGLELLPCKSFELASLAGGGGNGNDLGRSGVFNTSIFSVPFDAKALSRLYSTSNAQVPAANLKVNITVGNLMLVPKYRRFAVAPASKLVKGQSVSVVDHRRRMVRVNNQPWLGVGFYVSGALTMYNNASKSTLGLAKQTFHELSRQGMTQIMPYGMDTLAEADRAEVCTYLSTDLNASLKFDMPIVSDVVKILNSTVGSANYTAAWARMVAKIDSVRNSPALLGYYVSSTT